MSHIIRMDGAAPGRSSSVSFGDLVWSVATADDKSGDLRAQTADTLGVIDRNLNTMGTDKSRIISATVYITDMTQKSIMNEAWLDWVDTANTPQRACIGVVLEGDAKVEIAVVAAK